VPPYLCTFQVIKIRPGPDGRHQQAHHPGRPEETHSPSKDVEEINFEGTQLEKQVINTGTNTLIVRSSWRSASRTAVGAARQDHLLLSSKPTPAASKNLRQALSTAQRRASQSAGIGRPRVYGKGGLLTSSQQ